MAMPWEEYAASASTPPWQEYKAAASQIENAADPQKSFKDLMLARETNDLSTGVRRGVKDAIDTGAQGLAWLYDKATGNDRPTMSSLISGQKPQSEYERVKAMNQAGRDAYSQSPTTAGNVTGRVLGNLLSVTPATSLLGRAVGAVPGLGPLGESIATAGTNTGAKLPALGDAALRSAGGAINGYVSGGIIDPAQANQSAVLGGALPLAVIGVGGISRWAGNKLNSTAQSLMESALKPTLKQKQTGEAATAVDTLLARGINPTKGGVEKLQQLVNQTDDQITAAIQGSAATIDKANTLGPLLQTRAQFGAQVSPASDLQAIDNTVSGYLNHPTYPGMTLPVQDAQALKQGTYRVLSQKYGQLGSADTEAQKALARGLKEEIAAAVPGIADLNAEQSKLLSTLNVTERRALMDLNKNPGGLSWLASNPVTWAAFMADKSALFKSAVARMVNTTATALPAGTTGLLSGPAAYPIVRGGLLAAEQPN